MNVNGLTVALIVLLACPATVLAATPGLSTNGWTEQDMERLRNGEVLLDPCMKITPEEPHRSPPYFTPLPMWYGMLLVVVNSSSFMSAV